MRRPRHPNTRIVTPDDLDKLRESKRERYPFSAKTPRGSTPNPKEIEGNFCRFPAPFKKNEWMFETREERDKFVEFYGATPC